MKRKLSSTREPRSSDAKKPSNGNGNGHGPGHGSGHDARQSGIGGEGQRFGHDTGDANGRMLGQTTLLTALLRFRKGDFSVRLPVDLQGVEGKIADTFNDIIELNERMSKELERLSRVVGKEGRISQRASIGEVTGAWEDSVHSVNNLIGDLVHP